MRLGICSFSFHRSVASGAMDFAGFARFCGEVGCTQLDPWNAHLREPEAGEDGVRAGRNPHDARLGTPSDAHVAAVAAVAAEVGLPFGCIAVDGGHVYEEDAVKRAENRARAERWIEIAGVLGASSVRIDAGGPEDMPAPVLAEIVAGYRDLIAQARERGLQVLVENHWGPTVVPDNVLRLLDAVDGLGFLFDTNNWKPELRAEGWRRCAARADVVHVKTFRIGDDLVDAEVDLAPAFAALREAGFAGIWAVESVPRDGDEISAARRTVRLVRREAGAPQESIR